MLTLDKIYHAAFVLKDVARKTDLIEAPKLSKDCHLYLKTENLQVTGSFKVRGAYYKISQLSREEERQGRDRLLCRKPRTGRGSGRHPPGHQEHRLYAGRCPHYEGGKHQEPGRGGLSGARHL